MKLKRLEFGVFSSRLEESDPRKQQGIHAHVRISLDNGATWQDAPTTPEVMKNYSNGNISSGAVVTADLSGFAELQERRDPVLFRIYLYGQLGLYYGIGKRGNNWDVAVIGGVVEEE